MTDMSDAMTQSRPHFSRPLRQVLSMLIVLGLVGLGVFVALPRVLPVFIANPMLNGFILCVFLIGVLSCFWQVWQLMRSVRWIEAFTDPDGTADVKAPQLLAPLATMMRTRSAHVQISATSSRSILDSVGTRIEEDREITRYITNVLIYLGLLGTFFGLATTVPALLETIRSLAPGDGEAGLDVFNRLISGLESQLDGMGVAFASSLLGLAGSLVVGLLELFAGHGQNRFYRELEEWLSSITRLGLAGGEDATDREVMEAVLTQMSDQITLMQTMFATAAQDRGALDARLADLNTGVAQLAQNMDTSETVTTLRQVAHTQAQMMATLGEGGMEFGLDAESKMRLRSMDQQLLRLTEEIAAGRQEAMADLRADLARLSTLLRGGEGR